MSVSLPRSPRVSDTEDPVTWVLSEGASYTFGSKREPEGFRTPGSTAVSTDLGIQLFEEVVERENLPMHPVPVQMFEVQDWERMKKIIETLNALEAAFGMLNELTPEQREAFEKAVKRRPLFK